MCGQVHLETKLSNITHDFDGKLIYPVWELEEKSSILLKELQ